MRCPCNSGRYRFKRLTSSRTGRRQPVPDSRDVSGELAIVENLDVFPDSGLGLHAACKVAMVYHFVP